MLQDVLRAINNVSQWVGDIPAKVIALALVMVLFVAIAAAAFLACWALAWVLAKVFLWADERGVFDWIARHMRPITTERTRRNWRRYLGELHCTAREFTGR